MIWVSFISIIWFLIGFSLCRYLFGFRSLIILLPMSMGVGISLQTFLVNAFLYITPNIILAYWLSTLILLGAGFYCFWRFQASVEHEELGVSPVGVIAFFTVVMGISLLICLPLLRMGGLDAVFHEPLIGILANGQMPLNSPENPFGCPDYYHYGADLASAYLFRVSGISLSSAFYWTIFWGVFSTLGLAGAFIWEITERTHLSVGILGTGLFAFTGSANWIHWFFFNSWLRGATENLPIFESFLFRALPTVGIRYWAFIQQYSLSYSFLSLANTPNLALGLLFTLFFIWKRGLFSRSPIIIACLLGAMGLYYPTLGVPVFLTLFLYSVYLIIQKPDFKLIRSFSTIFILAVVILTFQGGPISSAVGLYNRFYCDRDATLSVPLLSDDPGLSLFIIVGLVFLSFLAWRFRAQKHTLLMGLGLGGIIFIGALIWILPAPAYYFWGGAVTGTLVPVNPQNFLRWLAEWGLAFVFSPFLFWYYRKNNPLILIWLVITTGLSIAILFIRTSHGYNVNRVVFVPYFVYALLYAPFIRSLFQRAIPYQLLAATLMIGICFNGLTTINFHWRMPERSVLSPLENSVQQKWYGELGEGIMLDLNPRFNLGWSVDYVMVRPPTLFGLYTLNDEKLSRFVSTYPHPELLKAYQIDYLLLDQTWLDRADSEVQNLLRSNFMQRLTEGNDSERIMVYQIMEDSENPLIPQPWITHLDEQLFFDFGPNRSDYRDVDNWSASRYKPNREAYRLIQPPASTIQFTLPNADNYILSTCLTFAGVSERITPQLYLNGSELVAQEFYNPQTNTLLLQANLPNAGTQIFTLEYLAISANQQPGVEWLFIATDDFRRSYSVTSPSQITCQ